MKILLWDIDGTLIRTDRAGIHAFQHAANALFKQTADFGKIPTSGRTDYFLAQEAIQNITGQSASLEQIELVLDKYEAALLKELQTRKGLVLPNVKEILADIAVNSNYVSLLLTGNTPSAARIKLEHFRLAQYFNFQHSAFGQKSADRNDLAKYALTIIKKYYQAASLEDILIIGDTPNDIRCADSINVKSLVVATGKYTLTELKNGRPWLAVKELPPPDEFKKLLSQ